MQIGYKEGEAAKRDGDSRLENGRGVAGIDTHTKVQRPIEFSEVIVDILRHCPFMPDLLPFGFWFANSFEDPLLFQR